MSQMIETELRRINSHIPILTIYGRTGIARFNARAVNKFWSWKQINPQVRRAYQDDWYWIYCWEYEDTDELRMIPTCWDSVRDLCEMWDEKPAEPHQVQGFYITRSGVMSPAFRKLLIDHKYLTGLFSDVNTYIKLVFDEEEENFMLMDPITTAVCTRRTLPAA